MAIIHSTVLLNILKMILIRNSEINFLQILHIDDLYVEFSIFYNNIGGCSCISVRKTEFECLESSEEIIIEHVYKLISILSLPLKELVEIITVPEYISVRTSNQNISIKLLSENKYDLINAPVLFRHSYILELENLLQTTCILDPEIKTKLSRFKNILAIVQNNLFIELSVTDYKKDTCSEIIICPKLLINFLLEHKIKNQEIKIYHETGIPFTLCFENGVKLFISPSGP